MRPRMIDLKPELLTKIQKLADHGFTEGMIQRLSGASEENFEAWILAGIASKDTPKEEQTEIMKLYSTFFDTIRKVPSETRYTKGSNPDFAGRQEV